MRAFTSIRPTSARWRTRSIRFLCDHRQRTDLASRARERAALFTWEASAQALIACFDELVHEANTAATSKSA